MSLEEFRVWWSTQGHGDLSTSSGASFDMETAGEVDFQNPLSVDHDEPFEGEPKGDIQRAGPEFGPSSCL